jgi:hypothetical protein
MIGTRHISQLARDAQAESINNRNRRKKAASVSEGRCEFSNRFPDSYAGGGVGGVGGFFSRCGASRRDGMAGAFCRGFNPPAKQYPNHN